MLAAVPELGLTVDGDGYVSLGTDFWAPTRRREDGHVDVGVFEDIDGTPHPDTDYLRELVATVSLPMATWVGVPMA